MATKAEQAAAEQAAAEQAAAEQAAAEQAAAEQAAADQAAENSAKVEAVCLMDSCFGKAGEVVLLSAIDAETGEANGAIDTHQAAIDYAKSQA